VFLLVDLRSFIMKELSGDVYSYEGMSKEELKDAIISLVIEKKKVNKNKKDFMSSCNEVIKELDSRISAVLDELDKE
jgi:hypothetical protein